MIRGLTMLFVWSIFVVINVADFINMIILLFIKIFKYMKISRNTVH